VTTPAPGPRILVVEDDEGIAASLVRGLAKSGYVVRHVASGADALAAATESDLVLLDLGLPDIDGTEICRALREHGDVPIIVVTARSEEADRVTALDIGADDYLVKPFGFAELTARIRALLRRSYGTDRDLLRHDGLVVDLRTHTVTADGTEVTLTPKEFDILALLTEDAGRVRTREEILNRVWDEHYYGPSKVIDVHVAALRRKLGATVTIEAVYGRGFRLGTAR
jgi:DNA-binding response OmpR family regulator